MFRAVGFNWGVDGFRAADFVVRRFAKGDDDVFKNIDVVHSQEACYTGVP